MRRTGVLSLLVAAAVMFAPSPASAVELAQERQVVPVASDSAPVMRQSLLVSIDVVASAPAVDSLMRVVDVTVPASTRELQLPDSTPDAPRVMPVAGSALDRSATTQRQANRSRSVPPLARHARRTGRS
jgi:hypothetical protein